MTAPFSIICGALRGSSAQTCCNTERVWPVAITMIIPASAAWCSALYVRGVMCLCGGGVRRVPSRSIANRRYMQYSLVDNNVKKRALNLIPQYIWHLAVFASAYVSSQPCQTHLPLLY